MVALGGGDLEVQRKAMWEGTEVRVQVELYSLTASALEGAGCASVRGSRKKYYGSVYYSAGHQRIS